MDFCPGFAKEQSHKHNDMSWTPKYNFQPCTYEVQVPRNLHTPTPKINHMQ